MHDTTTRVASAAAGETITGTVFRDVNGNGVQDGSEVTQSGITVKATDPAGGSVTTTSAANGTFSLNLNGLGPAAAAKYRVEFSIPGTFTYLKPAQIPAAATVGTTRNGGDVQFVTAPATGVTFAVENPGDYCGANPKLVTTCFSGIGSATNRTSLETIPYASGTTSKVSNANLMNPLPTSLQLRNTTGAIGGLAYHRGAQKVFAGAFAKRHTGYPSGPNDAGPDRIYVTNANASGAYTTFFAQEGGTDAHNYADPEADDGFWDQVGKTAWGNITVSEDDSTLFAINQFDKKLYVIPIINTAGTLTAGAATSVSFDNAAADCGIAGAAVNDWVPGAVEQKDGVVYLGITCTGEHQTFADRSKLQAIVYSWTSGPSATTKVANFPLTYARAQASGGDGADVIPGAWRNWITTQSLSVPGSPGDGRPYSQAGYPQPWLTGITFDEAHTMILGFTDRAEHQYGNVHGSDTGSVEGVSAGDTVKLTPSGANWTFTAGATGDEFYNTERYQYSGTGGTHQETSLGFLTHLPGTTEIVTNAFDPAPVGGTVTNAAGGSPASFPESYRSGGLIWMSTADGDRTRSYQIFGYDEPGTFGKVGGIGDVELICELAPIQLGNRIWNDADGDGIQDPAETGISGVTVHLKLAGTTVGTATTDASGNYVFGGLENANLNVGVKVLAGSAYTVELDNATNYAAANPLNNKAVSPNLIGANRQIDSNAALASPGTAIGAGNFPTFSYTTGGPGANDHTLDVGFMPLGTIGDTIFHDYNGNGTPEAGEGVNGVTVTVLWLGPDGVVGGGDDKTYTAVTNSSGVYTVTNLPPGNYTVTVDTSAAGLTGLANTTDPDGGNDSKSALTLPVGGSNLNQDFGYRGTASIGDFVWYDIDNDGVQDAGEPGIANATVTVLWAGPNGTFGDADDVSSTTTTNASGLYTKTGLDAGNYRVTVTNSTLPVGLRTQTFDLDGIATADQATTTLTTGQNRTDVDFGYRGTGTIGDTVWHDKDGNGAQGAGEPGIANVPVTVRWFGPDGISGNADDVVFNRTTDAAGNYLATNLPAGSFSVIVTTSGTLATLGLTTQTFDATGGLDSRSDLTLAAGGSNLNQDFGYRGGASLGDFVWYDVDGDGVQDPGEPGLGGVKVTAVWFGPDGVAGGGDDQTYTTTTNSSGGYTIGNLPAGNYSVTVDNTTLPNGITTPTFDLNGIGTPHTTTTTLTTNQNRTDVDFGYKGSGTIGDTIFRDVNGNGTQDVGDNGVANVPVTVTWGGPDGIIGGANAADDIVYPTTTNASGNYLVTGLPAGNFKVQVTTTGTLATLGLTSNTADPDAVKDSTSTLTLPLGGSNLNQDFGYTSTGSIGDFVWFDIDNDGVQDPGEPGLPSVKVTVVWCGTDNVCGSGGDDITYTTTTDSTGHYNVGNLPPGNYTVTVDNTTLPNGITTPTFDPNGTGTPHTTTTTLTTGQNRTDMDFGYRPTGTIGDTIFHDVDGNGAQNGTEPGIANVPVTVRWAGFDGILNNADDVLFPKTTNASGVYLVTNLPSGNYQVNVTTTGTLTTLGLTTNTADPDAVKDSTSTLTLGVGASNLLQDFGYRGSGTIGDTVFLDLDNDGTPDPGEGLNNIGVTLVWGGPDGIIGGANAADDITYTTTTNSSGLYLFSNLPAGPFKVTVNTATLPAGVTQTVDPDAVKDSTSTLSLTLGETNLLQDFGYRGTATIGDTIFHDVDGNGTQDAGDNGIGNVPVTVRWAGPNGTLNDGDDLVFSQNTDPTGKYLVTGLPAGLYQVTVTTTGTLTTLGLTANTADPDAVKDSTSTVTLATNDVNLLQDFGYRGAGSIGDTIFLDADNNGLPGAGEGLVGVGVTVRWCGVDGTCGNADDVLYPATTGAGGLYLVTGLPAGNYQVDVNTATLPAGVSNTVDPFGPKDSHSELTLPAGSSNLLQDFGYRYTGAIGDTIFHDQNGSGLPDAGEGLAGVLVTVSWAGPNGTFGDGDDVSYPTTTNAVGMYLVSGLAPGNYRVAVTTTGLITSMTLLNTVDPDAVKDSNSALTLGAGEINLKQDFGYRRKVNDKMYYFSLGGTSGPGAGAGQYDQTVTTLPYQLVDQQLVVSLRNGFTPAVGDTFDIVKAPSANGQYAAFYGTILPNGIVLDVQVLPDRVRLVATQGLFPTTTLDTVDATPGNGTCADSTGACSLRAAVIEANALPGRQSIVLNSGATYGLTRTGANEDAASTGDLDVNQDLSIVGSKAIIDGTLLSDGILHLRNGSTNNFSFFTVRNGASPTAGNAGGITVVGSQVLLTDLTVSGNTGQAAGGIATSASTVAVYRGSVTGNSSPGAGGIANTSTGASSVQLVDRTIVQGNTGGTGGGLRAAGPGTLSLVSNATVSGNGAALGGGVASSTGANLQLATTTVSSNTATSKGGGAEAEGALTLTDTNVAANTAPVGGGLASLGTAQVSISRVTFDSNTATSAGGAIQLEAAAAFALTSSTFSANGAPVGAALNAVGGVAAQVNSVTVAGNVGAGAALNATTGSINIINSIVSDQVAGANCSGTAGKIVSGGYNLTNTGSAAACGFTGTGDVQTATSALGAMANNGGFSKTRKPSTGSLAINTGSGCVAKDQRNFDRPRGGACDKGAVEV